MILKLEAIQRYKFCLKNIQVKLTKLTKYPAFVRFGVPDGCTICTHIVYLYYIYKKDLVCGYHQIPVHPADVPKTAIITPFGLFEFLPMAFGLRNAAQAFQHLMDTACRGLSYVFVYLDDILIFSQSQEEHKTHL